MNRVEERLLTALKAALNNEPVDWGDGISAQEWWELFGMAENHQILPMIFGATYRWKGGDPSVAEIFLAIKKKVMRSVMIQTVKTEELSKLYRYLGDQGLSPIIVKGIICRQLYPKPDERCSGDEDFLIPEGEFQQFHEAVIRYGMECMDSEEKLESLHEVSYRKPGSFFYIELHKELFPSESTAYGNFNTSFQNCFERSVRVRAGETEFRTMSPTEHVLYLILHAFKHFMHSGVGIRQVCDIILMANAYGEEIDWGRLFQELEAVHGVVFAAALFRIGEKYLTFDQDAAGWTRAWRELQVDEEPLLKDILSGGVYGSADRERLHSSTITLNAVAAQRQGKKTGVSVVKSVFPSASDLKGRYQYLEKKPFLLPAAWADRLWKYRKELRSGKQAAKSVKIGEQRVDLFRLYNIIK